MPERPPEGQRMNGPIMASGLRGLCDEYVPFKQQINCSGVVEDWLN